MSSWYDEDKPEDTCCACYGCPDHGHDCGLPPLQAAMRRAYYTRNRKKALDLLVVQGLVMSCPECGVLYDPVVVFGGKCIEHGGELMRPATDETETTVEEFDAMWEDSDPVETDTLYDWADDETLGYEETMRRFEALGPDVTMGPSDPSTTEVLDE